MGDPQSRRKPLFTKKSPDTTDRGRTYKDILTALFAFKSVNDNHFEDFNLSSNNLQHGSFDSIVLESIEDQKVSGIYVIQLKYKKNTTKSVTRDQLAAPTGAFSLQEHFECFKDIKKKYNHTNLNCYLYTNAIFEPFVDELTFRLEDKEHIEVSIRSILLSDSDLFNTSDGKCVYQFEVNQDNGSDDPEIAEYKDFFDHFFFYCSQKNVDDMESYAMNLFQKECCCRIASFEKYMEFIIKWSKLYGGKCLYKEIVSLKIGECLLRPLAISVSLFSGDDSSKFDVVLKQAFLHLDATILKVVKNEEVAVKRRLAELFGQVSSADADEASKMARDLPFDEIDQEQQVTLLWYMNKLPLILQVDGNRNILRNADKFCQRKKFIFIGQHIDTRNCQNLKIFQSLQDLPEDSSVYKKIVQETKISLQGRQETSLEDLIRNNEKAFTPVDLMSTTDDYLRVGEDKEELPHPYITQSLPKYVFDFMFLQENNSESLSVINAKQKLDIIKEKISGIKVITVEEFLKEVQGEEVEEANEIEKTFDTDKEQMKHLEPFVLVAEDECSLRDFRKICDKSPNKSCHHFRINSDNNMEWIRSNGNIEDLKKYKSFSNYISESEIFASSNSKINIITAKPGTGKTTLLKYLKNNIPSNYWIVNISLRKHFLFFQGEHSNSEILNYFLEDQAKRMKYNNFAIKIRNIFQSKGNLVFLWDGLDELPNNCLNEALKAIESFSDLCFINWITAREHLQPMLEAKFKVFALTIKEMEKEDQKSYIKQRLEAEYSEEKLEEFTQKIMKAVATTEGVSYLGVPFHINILTELFLRDAEKYNNLLDGTFTLTDLIQHSVEEKITFFYKNNCKCEDTNLVLEEIWKERDIRISQYELVALKTLLLAEDKDLIEEKFDNFHYKYEYKYEDDFGIILGVNDDDRAIFIHNIYGEYFVASWMTKNLELAQTFKDFFFEEYYSRIRLMFDMILAKDCPAHLAVLHNDFSSLLTHDNEIKRKDKAGRSPLHLACSWGEKRPVLPAEKFKDFHLIDDSVEKAIKEDNLQYRKILNFLIEIRKCDSSAKDNLFQWDCVEYATNSQCLLAVEVIAGNQNLEINSLQKYNDCTIWYYGNRFGYTNLLEKMKALTFNELKGNFKDDLEKLLTNIYHEHFENQNNDDLCVSLEENVPLTSNKLDTNPLGNIVNRNSSYESHLSRASYLCINSFVKNDLFDVNTLDLVTGRSDLLHKAVLSGNVETVRRFIETRANINVDDSDGKTPLHIAVAEGHTKIVQLLVQKGADLNKTCNQGCTPLYYAVEFRILEAMRILIKKNANMDLSDQYGRTPLYIAAIRNQLGITKMLLEAGADGNQTDVNGNSVLIATVNLKQKEVYEVLIKNCRNYGLNLDLLNNEDCSALYFAVLQGNEHATELLLENGASTTVRFKSNRNIVHLATLVGNGEILKLLVKRDVDINLSDENMVTPLHMAAYLGRTDCAGILLQNGADPFAKDSFGCTPRRIAETKGYHDLCQLIDSSLLLSIG